MSQGKALVGIDLYSYALGGQQNGGFATVKEGKTYV
jgi:hypothetical protein